MSKYFDRYKKGGKGKCKSHIKINQEHIKLLYTTANKIKDEWNGKEYNINKGTILCGSNYPLTKNVMLMRLYGMLYYMGKYGNSNTHMELRHLVSGCRNKTLIGKENIIINKIIDEVIMDEKTQVDFSLMLSNLSIMFSDMEKLNKESTQVVQSIIKTNDYLEGRTNELG